MTNRFYEESAINHCCHGCKGNEFILAKKSFSESRFHIGIYCRLCFKWKAWIPKHGFSGDLKIYEEHEFNDLKADKQ